VKCICFFFEVKFTPSKLKIIIPNCLIISNSTPKGNQCNTFEGDLRNAKFGLMIAKRSHFQQHFFFKRKIILSNISLFHFPEENQQGWKIVIARVWIVIVSKLTRVYAWYFILFFNETNIIKPMVLIDVIYLLYIKVFIIIIIL
jgi:hypothetical protein